MNKLLASAFYSIEVGRGRALVRLIPLAIVVAAILIAFDFKINKGFNDMQSMDNAQLGRQLERNQGFLTYFIRPYALAQVAAFNARKGQRELFPESTYPAGVPRAIPDTYNSPGYPVLLAGFYRVLHVDFDESADTMGAHRYISGDKWVPFLNQAFILLTAGVMFLFGLRLFDERVAWMGPVVLLFSDFVWKYSLMALPVSLLMLLMTVLLFGFAEIYRSGETLLEEGEKAHLGWGWLAVPGMAVLLGVMCLLCLPLLVVTLPLVLWLLFLPRTNWLLVPIFVGIVALLVAPWFFHWYQVCGNPIGSNFTLGLLGQTGYLGNEIYCSRFIPAWDMMLGGTGGKEYNGFFYHFQHAWELLGSNPMVLLFIASLLHEFRRKRVRFIQWLVVVLGLAIIAATNLADANPSPISSWNLPVVLLPMMIMIGAAFFFVLLDRMVTQLRLLTATVVVGMLALCLAPIVISFLQAGSNYYNYPPYLPPYLAYLSRLSPIESWVTSDMPWATAWYGDHPSLWLPDKIDDFTSIYDDDTESDFILFTPVTLSRPAQTLTSGELSEWGPLITGAPIPESFPLRHLAKLPGGGPEYSLLTNRVAR
jgi:hypothetical protein